MLQIFFNILAIAALGYGFSPASSNGMPMLFLILSLFLFALGHHFKWEPINKKRGPFRTRFLEWLKKDSKPVKQSEKYPFLSYLEESFSEFD